MDAGTQAAEPTRTRAEIEAEIDAARQRLAGNISDLVNQVHPRAVVHNTMTDARRFVSGGYQQVREQLVGDDGVRGSRVALAAGAAAGAVAFALVVRSIFRGR